jgi:hypothetical protein
MKRHSRLVFVLMAILAAGWLFNGVESLDALPKVPSMAGVATKPIGATGLASALDPATGRLYVAGNGFVREV